MAGSHAVSWLLDRSLRAVAGRRNAGTVEAGGEEDKQVERRRKGRPTFWRGQSQLDSYSSEWAGALNGGRCKIRLRLLQMRKESGRSLWQLNGPLAAIPPAAVGPAAQAGSAQIVQAGQAPQRRRHRPREHVVTQVPVVCSGGRRADGEEAEGATQNALRRLRVKWGKGVPSSEPGNLSSTAALPARVACAGELRALGLWRLGFACALDIRMKKGLRAFRASKGAQA